MKTHVKLSEHVQDGEFRAWKKFINGKRFYFAKDLGRAVAERQALALCQASTDGLPWTAERIAKALEAWNTTEATQTSATEGLRPRIAASGTTTVSTLSLHKAADLYAAYLYAKVPNQLSHSNYLRQKVSMGQIKAAIADMALSTVGYDQLSNMVAYFVSRPISQATKRPIAVDTVRNIVKDLRNLFDYLADSGKWEECRRYTRLFRIDAERLYTAQEKKTKAEGVKTFTVDELKTLWSYANPQQRLYMLLALNTSAQNNDLATLHKDHIEGDCKVIRRERNKTSVLGVYPLWDATAKALRNRLMNSPKRSDGLILTTADGKQLVWFGVNRTDSVNQTWKRLITACNYQKKDSVRYLPFKYLRKTGAQLIFDATGSLEVTQLFLSHSGIVAQSVEGGSSSVAERHYVNARDFDKLAEGLRLVEAKLVPVFQAERLKNSYKHTKPLPKVDGLPMAKPRKARTLIKKVAA